MDEWIDGERELMAFNKYPLIHIPKFTSTFQMFMLWNMHDVIERMQFLGPVSSNISNQNDINYWVTLHSSGKSCGTETKQTTEHL